MTINGRAVLNHFLRRTVYFHVRRPLIVFFLDIHGVSGSFLRLKTSTSTKFCDVRSMCIFASLCEWKIKPTTATQFAFCMADHKFIHADVGRPIVFGYFSIFYIYSLSSKIDSKKCLGSSIPYLNISDVNVSP